MSDHSTESQWMARVDSRLESLEHAHRDGQKMLYGWADPTAPGGYRKGIITTLSEGLEKVGLELTDARKDFSRMIGSLKWGARAAWALVTVVFAGTIALFSFVDSHAAVIGRILQRIAGS